LTEASHSFILVLINNGHPDFSGSWDFLRGGGLSKGKAIRERVSWKLDLVWEVLIKIIPIIWPSKKIKHETTAHFAFALPVFYSGCTLPGRKSFKI
jgi:hypothetical protein